MEPAASTCLPPLRPSPRTSPITVPFTHLRAHHLRAHHLRASPSQNEAGLRDLAEMGFTDAKLNAKLLIKNGGSVKNTVRDLLGELRAEM